MKDEPWRGNPALRCLHLEKKIHNQKVRLAEQEKELGKLRGLLNEWVGQHASAEGLLADTKAYLEAGEGEPGG